MNEINLALLQKLIVREADIQGIVMINWDV
jgi:hypothetical protein